MDAPAVAAAGLTDGATVAHCHRAEVRAGLSLLRIWVRAAKAAAIAGRQLREPVDPRSRVAGQPQVTLDSDSIRARSSVGDPP